MSIKDGGQAFPSMVVSRTHKHSAPGIYHHPGSPGVYPHGASTELVAYSSTELDSVPGMSLRDYFAAKAMQGDWAAQSEGIGEFTDQIRQDALEERARIFYRMADAMLKAREQQP